MELAASFDDVGIWPCVWGKGGGDVAVCMTVVTSGRATAAAAAAATACDAVGQVVYLLLMGWGRRLLKVRMVVDEVEV